MKQTFDVIFDVHFLQNAQVMASGIPLVRRFTFARHPVAFWPQQTTRATIPISTHADGI